MVRILDFQRVLSMTRRPNFRRRFFSEIGAAIVVLAALCAFAASVASISAYPHEYGSWCGTVRREIQSNVGLWVPALSFSQSVASAWLRCIVSVLGYVAWELS